jgi:hypothetical protein
VVQIITILNVHFSSLLINPINASGYCLLRDDLRQAVAANAAKDIDIDIDIFVNCNWVGTRWQYTFTRDT